MDGFNHEIVINFLVLIGATTFITTLFHYLRFPTIVGFILSGCLVGPFGLKLVSSVPGASMLSEIGIIFLMFTIGLEFSPQKLRYFLKPFILLGGLQVILSATLAALISYFIAHLSLSKSIVIGFLFSLSSTAIVMKILQDQRETATPYGTNTLSILLAQDLAVIPMMLMLPLLALTDAQGFMGIINKETLGIWVIKILLIAICLLLVARYIVPVVFRMIARTGSRELFFFGILLLCFGVAAAMEKIGLSLSFGAFLAGLMISESSYARQATADIMPLRDNFLGLFFTSVGMLVNVPGVLPYWYWILLVFVLTFLLKSSVVYILSRLLRYPHSISILTALAVFQIGEFSFILAQSSLRENILSFNEVQMFLAVSVMTMIATPFVFKLAPKWAFSSATTKKLALSLARAHSQFIELDDSVTGQVFTEYGHDDKERFKAHTIIIGYGIAGKSLAQALAAVELPYVVIEQNYETVREFSKKDIPIMYGDASRREILEEAGIDQARLVAITASGKSMIAAILRQVRFLRPDIHTILRLHYARDARELKDEDLTHCELVIAEHQTAIDLIARTLSIYGVPEHEIRTLMADLRESFHTHEITDYLQRNIDLPAWKAFSSIRPLLIKEGYAAIGKSIADLQIRRQTGASVVAVYREGLGTTIPGPDFVFEQDDVLQVIGDKKAYELAKALLENGSLDTA